MLRETHLPMQPHWSPPPVAKAWPKTGTVALPPSPHQP
jgi:hypothetical protein